MLTLDTSGVIALTNRRDPNHGRAKKALSDARGPHLLPAAIMAEVAYWLEHRAPHVVDEWLADIEFGRYALDCGDSDMTRVRQLVNRYEDLPLGFADAAVIACAERNGGQVLTFDLRDFGVVAREGTITLLPPGS